ncbi:Rh27 [macacine betaherpesvirus 3]|nr:Rh27 [macacine betaherpesvirus 3]APT40111.1 Rh27 [macacine betaherpesvirus 3]
MTLTWTRLILLSNQLQMIWTLECTITKVITTRSGNNIRLGDSSRQGNIVWHQPPCDNEQDVLCNKTSRNEEMFFTNRSISFMCEQKSNMLNLRGLTPGNSGQYCKTISTTRNGNKESYRECYNLTVISNIKSTTPKIMTTQQETSSHRPSNVTPSRFLGRTINNKRDRYDDLAPALELVGFLFFITIVVLFCLRTELFEGM